MHKFLDKIPTRRISASAAESDSGTLSSAKLQITFMRSDALDHACARLAGGIAAVRWLFVAECALSTKKSRRVWQKERAALDRWIQTLGDVGFEGLGLNSELSPSCGPRSLLLLLVIVFFIMGFAAGIKSVAHA